MQQTPSFCSSCRSTAVERKSHGQEVTGSNPALYSFLFLLSYVSYLNCSPSKCAPFSNIPIKMDPWQWDVKSQSKSNLSTLRGSHCCPSESVVVFSLKISVFPSHSTSFGSELRRMGVGSRQTRHFANTWNTDTHLDFLGWGGCSMLSTCLSTIFLYLGTELTTLGALKFEPGTAGKEVETQPLC